jgi:hypothetical protein
MDNFLDKIRKQLEQMTETQKDAWVLSQAKLLPERKREDFYKSLCGTKKVIDMPERSEIDEFCDKVRNGDITVEYYTYYFEFDASGNYCDDWDYRFYDPNDAMPFISSVVSGCHDLILLEEYDAALEILDDIISLEFVIEDHPDSEDICEDEFIDLDRAIREGILNIDRDNLLRDYIEACTNASKECINAADKITAAFEMELFRKCETENCLTVSGNDPLLNDIKKNLSEDLKRFEREYNEKIRKDEYYRSQYSDEERIEHINKLIEYFEKI